MLLLQKLELKRIILTGLSGAGKTAILDQLHISYGNNQCKYQELAKHERQRIVMLRDLSLDDFYFSIWKGKTIYRTFVIFYNWNIILTN